MTRNFSNQGRDDDMHPSSRNSTPGRFRENQTSRPARQRLSRDAVDRAWENGATRTYADYHPRRNAPTSFDRSRQPQNRRPYNTEREQYGEPRNYQPRSRSGEGQHRFEQPEYRSPGRPNSQERPWTRDDARQAPERRDNRRPAQFRPQGSETNYRDSYRPPRQSQAGFNTFRGTQPHAPRFQNGEEGQTFRQERPARFSQDNRRPERTPQNGRDDFRQGRPGRFQERDQHGPSRERSFERGERGPNGAAGRDNFNPRWQSRPGQQRPYEAQQPPARDRFANQRSGGAQFEGDYEHYNDYQRSEAPRYPALPEYQSPAYEPPVTRLPDGRVLRGSRPSQRRQARFWNEIEGQTSELVAPEQSEPSQARPPYVAPEQPAARPTKAPRTPRPATPNTGRVKKVRTARADETKARTAKVARKNSRGPQKPVTRPSKRGYKWPNAGDSAPEE